MKEIMCTHLSKRGSTYYYRRKTPIHLVHIYGAEVVKSLGTKERKIAEILVRQLGADYDKLFTSAMQQPLGSGEISLPIHFPPILNIMRRRPEDGLDLDDANLYTVRFLKQIRKGRARSLIRNEYESFNQLGLHPLQ